MSVRRSSFQPAWWLPGPHLQTIVPSRMRRFRPPPRIRQRMELPDGDFIDLDWAGTEFSGRPLVIVLHGLTGSSESQYAWGLQRALLARRIASVVLNFRGCSGEPNRLPRAYHSGETEDLRELVRWLQDHPEHGTRPLAAVGYSLGGNVLLKWLGEEGTGAPLRTAVAVSVPYDLAACQRKLDHGVGRIYGRHLLRNLQQAALEKRRHFHNAGARDQLHALLRLGEIGEYRSLWEFDDRVTAPLHGFRDAADYYAQSSSGSYLSTIRTPTLLIHALDDPFVDARAIPGADDLGPATELELSAQGGHVGFVSGSLPLVPHYWLEQRIPDHLQLQLDGPA